MSSSERVGAVLVALAEPNRLRIVELLRDRPRSVNEMVEGLQLQQSLVSKHLRVLREAGLVSARTDARQRIYSLEAVSFLELGTWLDRFAEVWVDRMDALETYAHRMENDGRRSSDG